MKTTRRHFVKASLAGTLGAAVPASSLGAAAAPISSPRYAQLDEVLRQPVFKRELFASPVIIESLELLRYKDSFLCRVRSRDGAEGISVAHSTIAALYPIFLLCLKPFFLGKYARDLELILERVFVYK